MGLGGEEGDSAGREGKETGVGAEIDGAFEDIQEALQMGRGERAAGFELGGVLGEGGTGGGANVGRRLSPYRGPGRAVRTKVSRRLQEVVALVAAAGVAKVMHGPP